LGDTLANELDELTGPVNSEGRDVNVIDKQLKIETGWGTKLFDIALWVVPIPLVFGIAFAATEDILIASLSSLLGLLPGIIFAIMKTNALAYLRQLQQRIQADLSQIDNFLEQRVVILENLTILLAKSIDVDKDVMKTVAAYRGGVNPNSDLERNQASTALDGSFGRINLAFEAYPELKSQDNILDAMRQNSYLQKEITAARTLCNDTIATWNIAIYNWPTNQIVAAKQGYTTRIPFTASAEIKAQARGTFFN
jgi:LemA protein